MDGGDAGQPVPGHAVVRFFGRGSKKASQEYCAAHGWTCWFAMDGWSRAKRESFKVHCAARDIAALYGYMTSLPEHKRHFYEIIPMNAPCRFFADMEYANAANPALVGREDDLLAAAVSFFSERIAAAANVSPPQPADFVATTAHKPGPSGKFSVHLSLPNAPVLFSGFHTSLKAFMDESADEWIQRSEQDLVPSVYDRDGNRIVPWDQGIYQRDRLMRMAFSSKRESEEEDPARQRPLLLNGRNLDAIASQESPQAARAAWEMSMVVPTADFPTANPVVVTRGGEGAERRARRGAMSAELEAEIADGGPLSDVVVWIARHFGITVTRVRMVDLERLVAVFETSCRMCPIRSNEHQHRRNTAFMVVSIREYRIEVRPCSPRRCARPRGRSGATTPTARCWSTAASQSGRRSTLIPRTSTRTAWCASSSRRASPTSSSRSWRN